VGPCRVLAYAGEGHVTGRWLDATVPAPAPERLLLKTRNSDRWAAGAPFDERFVALEESAASWCVERGVRLVGVDYLSVEPFGSGKRGHPVHLTLLGAGVVIVEGVDLHAVEPGDYELVCAPLKLESGDGAPARVFLVER